MATKSEERDLPGMLPDDVSAVVVARQNSNWTIAAFVLFAAGLVGKQPLTALALWSDIAVPEGNLFSTAVLSCRALMEGAEWFTPYLSNWPKRSISCSS